LWKLNKNNKKLNEVIGAQVFRRGMMIVRFGHQLITFDDVGQSLDGEHYNKLAPDKEM